MPTEILLLGATGPAGLETLKRALAEPDVHVTVYARSPDKIPADLRASGSAAEKLTVLAPAGLEDVEALRQAVTQTRPDAVISLLGPAQHDFLAWMNPFGGGGRGRTVFADAYRVVLDGLRECGGGRPRRIYAMGTISIPDPRDRPSLLARLMVLAVWLVVHRAWRNVVSVGRFFDSLSSEEYADIQWTLFRLGAVVDGLSTPNFPASLCFHLLPWSVCLRGDGMGRQLRGCDRGLRWRRQHHLGYPAQRAGRVAGGAGDQPRESLGGRAAVGVECREAQCLMLGVMKCDRFLEGRGIVKERKERR